MLATTDIPRFRAVREAPFKVAPTGSPGDRITNGELIEIDDVALTADKAD